MTDREQQFMRMAIELSREGMQKGEGGPFGCVIVKGNEVIGKGNNCVTALTDPTAHAEIVAIRNACLKLNTFQLTDCEIYTSCEPCPMCLGAIYWARPKKVYYANTRHDAAGAGFDDSFIYDELTASLSKRAIEMICLGREEALKVFEEWRQKPDKTVY